MLKEAWGFSECKKQPELQIDGRNKHAQSCAKVHFLSSFLSCSRPESGGLKSPWRLGEGSVATRSPEMLRKRFSLGCGSVQKHLRTLDCVFVFPSKSDVFWGVLFSNLYDF